MLCSPVLGSERDLAQFSVEALTRYKEDSCGAVNEQEQAVFSPVFADPVDEPEFIQDYMTLLFQNEGESLEDEDSDTRGARLNRQRELKRAHSDSVKRMGRKREHFNEGRGSESHFVHEPQSPAPSVAPVQSSPPINQLKKRAKFQHALAEAVVVPIPEFQAPEQVVIDMESVQEQEQQGSGSTGVASTASDTGTLSNLSYHESTSSTSDSSQNEDGLSSDEVDHQVQDLPTHPSPAGVDEESQPKQKHIWFKLDEIVIEPAGPVFGTEASDKRPASRLHPLIDEEERDLLVKHSVVSEEFAFLLEELFELNADKEVGMMSRDMLFMFYAAASNILNGHKKLFDVRVVKYPSLRSSSGAVSSSTGFGLGFGSKKSLLRLVTSVNMPITGRNRKPRSGLLNEGNSCGTPSALLSSKSDKMKAKKLGVLRIIQGLVHISNPPEAYDFDDHDGLSSSIPAFVDDKVCFVPLMDRLEFVHTDILTLLTAYIHMCFDNTTLLSQDPKFCLALCEASCQAMRNFTRNPRNCNFIVTHHLLWSLVDAFRKSLPSGDMDFGNERSLSIAVKLIDTLNNVMLHQREVEVVRIELSLIKEERAVQERLPEIITKAMRASSNHFFTKAVAMARRFCPLFPDKFQSVVAAMLQRLCRAGRGDDRFVRMVGEALIDMGAQSIEKKGIFGRTVYPIWKQAIDIGMIPVFVQLMFHDDAMICEKAILSLMAMCNKKLDVGGSSDLVYRPLVSLLLKILPDEEGRLVVSLFEDLITNLDKPALLEFRLGLSEFRDVARQRLAKEIPLRFRQLQQ